MPMNVNVFESLSLCTTRIECVGLDGNKSSGTGFFVHLLEDSKVHIPVVVTNKHVIEHITSGRLTVSTSVKKGQTEVGHHQTVCFSESDWILHPDSSVDLAALPLANAWAQFQKLGIKPHYAPLDKNLVWSVDKLKTLAALEEVIMIGYPNGLWDSANNRPIFRKGITATPVYIYYEGKKEFVIDMACFPGSSGSPVFLVNSGGYMDNNGGLHIGGDRLIFFGVLYAGPIQSIEGEIKVAPIPTTNNLISVSNVMINLGYCINAERVFEFEEIFKSLLAANKQQTHS
ncbi:MAG: serine protease [Robiginitomaculum sp.]|nr:MAG: serine protease [Robiginitomaculum sp.]